MKSMQYVLILFLSIISAFLGGALSVWFLMLPSVLAQDEPPKVIEAEQFRVVDEEGKTMARLSLAGLFIYDPPNVLPIARYDYMGLKLNVENGFVHLSRDGILLLESHGTSLKFDPVLGLSLHDSEGNLRVALGTTRLEHANTGSTEIRAPSSLVLFDEDGKVVWSAP